MIKIENYQLYIENFKILSNGADDGHRYIVTEMQFKGSLKRVSVFLTIRQTKIDWLKIHL